MQPQPAIDTAPPEISNLSVHNQTYPSPDVPLNFTLKDSTSRIAYSLDGCENVTIGGNTTLNGLSAGKHTVTVFCWDDAGNVGSSETITFTVDKQPESTSTSEPFPWLSVAAAVAVAAVVAVAALVYLKTRKSRDTSVVKNP
jgi:hypothetical protein